MNLSYEKIFWFLGPVYSIGISIFYSSRYFFSMYARMARKKTVTPHMKGPAYVSTVTCPRKMKKKPE